MNTLLVCPHCNGAISRATQTCPICGTAIGRGREGSHGRRVYDVAPQSVFLIVVDAIRAGPGRHRPESASMTRAVGDS